MIFDDLKNALSEAMLDLNPAEIPEEPVEYEMVTLDRSETDNSKWLSYMTAALVAQKPLRSIAGTRKLSGSSWHCATAS